MATSSLMLRIPCLKSRIAVATIGMPRITEPISALPLATIVPLSNSQSTTKAFNTNTTPSSVCHQRTGACSCPQPHESSCSFWCAKSFLLKSDETCIKLFSVFYVLFPLRDLSSLEFRDSSFALPVQIRFRQLTIKIIPKLPGGAMRALGHENCMLHIRQHPPHGLGPPLLGKQKCVVMRVLHQVA